MESKLEIKGEIKDKTLFIESINGIEIDKVVAVRRSSSPVTIWPTDSFRKNRWTKMTEELPVWGVRVLGAYAGGGMCIFSLELTQGGYCTEIADFDGINSISSSNAPDYGDIAFWMPLPDPPNVR